MTDDAAVRGAVELRHPGGGTEPAAEPTIASQAVGTFIVQLVTYAIGFAASVVISRAVGPRGRGEYYVAVTAALIIGNALDLSVLRAMTYLRANRGVALVDLGGITATVGVIVAPIAIALMYAAFVLLRHSVFRGVDATEFTIVAVSVPFQVSLNWLTGLFALGHRVTLSRIALMVGGIVQTAGAVTLYALGDLDVQAVLLLFLAAAVVPWTLCLWWGRSFAPFRPTSNFHQVREVLGFGARLHFGFLFWFLLLNFDTFLVKLYLGSAAVGRYSLAVLFGSVVFLLVESVAWAALPFQSEGSTAETSDLTFKAVRFGLATAIALAGAGIALLWAVIPVVYGQRFGGAYLAFVVLVPGVVAMVAAGPLQNVLIRQGRPWTMTAVNLVPFGLNVVLNVILLKPLGIVGASVSATTAYTVNAAALLLWARREWQVPLWAALKPNRSDIETVRRYIATFEPRRPRGKRAGAG